MIAQDDGDCKPEANFIFIIYFACVDAHLNNENRPANI